MKTSWHVFKCAPNSAITKIKYLVHVSREIMLVFILIWVHNYFIFAFNFGCRIAQSIEYSPIRIQKPNSKTVYYVDSWGRLLKTTSLQRTSIFFFMGRIQSPHSGKAVTTIISVWTLDRYFVQKTRAHSFICSGITFLNIIIATSYHTPYTKMSAYIHISYQPDRYASNIILVLLFTLYKWTKLQSFISNRLTSSESSSRALALKQIRTIQKCY